MRKVLYVDVNPLKYPSEGSQERVKEEQRFITEGLSKEFSVFSVNNFLSDFVDEMLQKEYDGLVTHIPPSKSRYFPYEESLRKVDRIFHIHPSLFIVAYTGASQGDITNEELYNRGVQGIVRKQNPEKDLQALLSVLNPLLMNSNH